MNRKVDPFAVFNFWESTCIEHFYLFVQLCKIRFPVDELGKNYYRRFGCVCARAHHSRFCKNI